MFKIKSYLVTLVLVFCVVWFTGAADLAAEESGEDVSQPVAKVSIGSNGIGWEPKVEYAQLVLTVSAPDGSIFSKTFKSGSTPYLDSSDLKDGLYMYELRVIPAGKQDRKPGSQGEVYTPKALLQSGSFRVEKNQFVIPKSSGSGAGTPSAPGEPGVAVPQAGDDLAITQDICYNDDLIVDGSLCVGFDCTCNYSFGFDTIVLKENNLRIFFDDTSVASSFPRNDWRIIINDSANGGSSYFGVEDSSAGRRVFSLEAGAPTHSLYVDDGGRVGLGTSTPSVELHVIDGDTPTLRLQQDGSSGFAPQTWDVAGNETNFFVRDVTNGSTLPFRIRPTAPSSSIFIDADGAVGFGTTSPDGKIEVAVPAGSTEPGLLITSDTNTLSALNLVRDGDSTAKFVAGGSAVQFGSVTNDPVKVFVNDSTEVFSFNTDGSLSSSTGASLTAGGVWTSVSSREAKENIRDLSTEDALETLDELNPVRYNYKVDKEEEYIGFVAEDVPELVATKDRKGMVSMDVAAVLTKVVKEQQKTISELKEEIAELKKKVE